MSIPEVLVKLFKQIDANEEKYIEDLRQVISIPSISSQPCYTDDINKIIEWTESYLRRIGFRTERRKLRNYSVKDDTHVSFPPLLLSHLGNDLRKKTVCFYGYLDVYPVKIEEWKFDPFTLTRERNRLYGRGTSDNKSAVLCWIHAIEAYQATGEALPVNIKLVLETIKEAHFDVGKEAIKQLIINEEHKFFRNVDYFCIGAGFPLDRSHPNLIYSLKGHCYFYLEIKCAVRDLESGSFGGSVYESLPDLLYLLNQLINKRDFLLPGDLFPLEPYAKSHVDVDYLKAVIGSKAVRYAEDQGSFLRNWWRNPVISVHGIEGAFCERVEKSVIPSRTIAKLSARVLPSQTVQDVEILITEFLENIWSERGSTNEMKLTLVKSIPAWIGDVHHANYLAAIRAIEYVHKKSPNLVCEGYSLDMPNYFKGLLKKSVVIIPITNIDCYQHSGNENIDVQNYIQGDLRQAIEIRSIPTTEAYENEIRKMIKWTTRYLKSAGFKTVVKELNVQGSVDSRSTIYCPVILSTLGTDVTKNTVLIWGHLDVQPANSGLWESDPFKLTNRDEKLFGRGTAVNKASILCWLHAIEAYQAIGEALPVNVKLMLDAAQESYEYNVILAEVELLKEQKDAFFNNVDYVVTSSGFCLDNNRPYIIYGLKGLIRFIIEIKCANRDLHSGLFGGSLYEGFPDLIHLLNSLVDREGIFLIADLDKHITAIDLENIKKISQLDIDVVQFKKMLGIKTLYHGNDKMEFFTRWWRYPTLSIHRIEGGNCDKIEKLIIPSCVTGVFSIRLVPNQDINETKQVVLKYLYDKWMERNSINQLKLYMNFAANPWTGDPTEAHFKAAMDAAEYVYNKPGHFVCESYVIPLINHFEEILKTSAVVIPICRIHTGPHAANEFIDTANYIRGTKVFAAYLYTVSKLDKKTTSH